MTARLSLGAGAALHGVATGMDLWPQVPYSMVQLLRHSPVGLWALVPSGHCGAIPRAVIEALLGAGAVVTSVSPALLAQVLWSSVQAL